MIKHIGIIGLGSIGSRHLKLLKINYPNIEISVLRSGKGVKNVEEKSANRIIYSMNELIELNPEAVIISSPASEHLNQALTLAQAGIHILIEKPLSISIDGIDELTKVIKENNVVAQIGYMFRHDPCANKVKYHIDNKILGKILHVRVDCGSYLPEWRPDQDYKRSVSSLENLGGGVLLELSHEIDYLHWFFGEMSSVYAYLHNSKTLEIDVEESADLVMTSDLGFPISVHLDFNRRKKSRECTIYGELGELKWNLKTSTFSIIKAGENTIKKNFSFEMNDLYTNQLQHFINCIINHRVPKINVQDGFNTLKLIDAARFSNTSGKRVYLK